MNFGVGVRLDQYQQKIVEHKEGPMLCLAGAGSGKTASIVTRIVNLAKSGVDPSKIFASTFTNKAAEEMRERVARDLGFEAEYVQISTLHSFGYKVLKTYIRKTQRGKKIELANDGAIWLYLTKLIKEEDLHLKDVKSILQKISKCKLNCISPEEYYEKIDSRIKEDLNRFDVTNNKELSFHYIFKKYEQYLQRLGQIDFSDMLYKVYKIFKNPKNSNFLKAIQDRIDYLIIDEMQDINGISLYIYSRIIERTNNVLAVGDIRQAIYSFQGADVTLVDEFIDKFKPTVEELFLNYRSNAVIVERANTLIQNCERLKQLKDSKAHRPKGKDVTVKINESEMQEASDVADTIESLVNSGKYQHKDIAVLFRINSQAVPLVDTFIGRSIPYKLYKSYSMFNKKEFKVVINYMRAAIDPESMSRNDFWTLANNPVRYIKKLTFNKIEDHFDDGLSESFYEAMTESDSIIKEDLQRKNIASLNQSIRDIARYARNSDGRTCTILRHIIEDRGIKAWFEGEGRNSDMDFKGGGADSDREMEFNTLYSMGEKYADPNAFLNYVKACENEEKSDRRDKKKDKDENKVHMLTAHSSKGMEFPVVLVVGMSDRTMPFYKAVEEGNSAEERRIAYVAFTRAEEELFLFNIRGRLGRYYVTPSKYLVEMGLMDAVEYARQLEMVSSMRPNNVH